MPPRTARFRSFYDRIEVSQTTEIAPKLRRINEILLAAGDSPYRGHTLAKHEIKFGKLWTLDPLREAQRRQALATADAAYVSAGVYLPEEVALSRYTGESPDEIQISPEARKFRLLGIQAGLEDLGTDPYAEQHVEGFIEVFPERFQPEAALHGVTIVMDEDGDTKELPLNLSFPSGIVGPIVVCITDEEGDEQGMPEEQAKLVARTLDHYGVDMPKLAN